MLQSLALVILVAAQDLALAQIAPAVHPITAQEKKAIAAAVSDQMKDPEAAHFRWVPNIAMNGRYCGLVNGKNGYGGYFGYTPFQVHVGHGPDGAITVSDVSIAMDANISEAMRTGCAQVGLDLTSAAAE